MSAFCTDRQGLKMKCSDCGHIIVEKQAKFCSNCGFKLFTQPATAQSE